MRAARLFVLSSAASVGRFCGRSSGTGSADTLSSSGPLSCLAWPFTTTADSNRLRPTGASGRSLSTSASASCCSRPPFAGPTTSLLILLPSRLLNCLLLSGWSRSSAWCLSPSLSLPCLWLSLSGAELRLPCEYRRSKTEGLPAGGSRGPGPGDTSQAHAARCSSMSMRRDAWVTEDSCKDVAISYSHER
jgi:hypothetical protein